MKADVFAENGFALVPEVFSVGECGAIAGKLALDAGTSGTRCLLQQAWCAVLAQRLRQHTVLSNLIGPKLVAVQCTYFEKSAERNWLVAIHQDLSIPVAEHVDAPELRGWSEKEGTLFVQPPTAVLEQLVAIRLHLDVCSMEDGPLRVVPGSHLAGRIDASEALCMRDAEADIACPAERGDVLVLRPLVLHASSKSRGSSRRRVLHFVYGPRELPHGLQWPRTA